MLLEYLINKYISFPTGGDLKITGSDQVVIDE